MAINPAWCKIMVIQLTDNVLASIQYMFIWTLKTTNWSYQVIHWACCRAIWYVCYWVAFWLAKWSNIFAPIRLVIRFTEFTFSAYRSLKLKEVWIATGKWFQKFKHITLCNFVLMKSQFLNWQIDPIRFPSEHVSWKLELISASKMQVGSQYALSSSCHWIHNF